MKMIGKAGRFPCGCCSDFGHDKVSKKMERRATKRRERQAWKKEVR